MRRRGPHRESMDACGAWRSRPVAGRLRRARSPPSASALDAERVASRPGPDRARVAGGAMSSPRSRAHAADRVAATAATRDVRVHRRHVAARSRPREAQRDTAAARTTSARCSRGIAPIVAWADFAICHLETPVAPDGEAARARRRGTACRRRSRPASPRRLRPLQHGEQPQPRPRHDRHRRDGARARAGRAVADGDGAHARGGSTPPQLDRGERHHRRPPVVHVELQRVQPARRPAVAVQPDRPAADRRRRAQASRARGRSRS